MSKDGIDQTGFVSVTDDCPCGSGEEFALCCGPLHAGQRMAATAEELMRSRYSAYAVGDMDYVEGADILPEQEEEVQPQSRGKKKPAADKSDREGE